MPAKPLDRAREIAAAAIENDPWLREVGASFRDVTMVGDRPEVHWEFPNGINGSDGLRVSLTDPKLGKAVVDAVRRAADRHNLRPAESDIIVPALSESEWHDREFKDERGYGVGLDERINIRSGLTMLTDEGLTGYITNIPGTIALANAALTDDDPRKFTRDTVRALRAAIDRLEPGQPKAVIEHAEAWLRATLVRHAAALESYLPPETG